jgi:hypothetical protein
MIHNIFLRFIRAARSAGEAADDHYSKYIYMLSNGEPFHSRMKIEVFEECIVLYSWKLFNIQVPMVPVSDEDDKRIYENIKRAIDSLVITYGTYNGLSIEGIPFKKLKLHIKSALIESYISKLPTREERRACLTHCAINKHVIVYDCNSCKITAIN